MSNQVAAAAPAAIQHGCLPLDGECSFGCSDQAPHQSVPSRRCPAKMLRSGFFFFLFFHLALGFVFFLGLLLGQKERREEEGKRVCGRQQLADGISTCIPRWLDQPGRMLTHEAQRAKAFSVRVRGCATLSSLSRDSLCQSLSSAVRERKISIQSDGATARSSCCAQVMVACEQCSEQCIILAAHRCQLRGQTRAARRFFSSFFFCVLQRLTTFIFFPPLPSPSRPRLDLSFLRHPQPFARLTFSSF